MQLKRTGFYVLFLIQVVLFGCGIKFIIEGSVVSGVFNIIINGIFGYINLIYNVLNKDL